LVEDDVELIFEGLDTVATIRLNGVSILASARERQLLQAPGNAPIRGRPATLAGEHGVGVSTGPGAGRRLSIIVH